MNGDDQRWREPFESERARLIDALGKVTEGGIIEGIEHIGATSVPGLYGSACIDIGLAVWPFPLEPGPKSQLEVLGYGPITGYEEKPEQRFRHESGLFQLYSAIPNQKRDYGGSEAISRPSSMKRNNSCQESKIM